MLVQPRRQHGATRPRLVRGRLAAWGTLVLLLALNTFLVVRLHDVAASKPWVIWLRSNSKPLMASTTPSCRALRDMVARGHGGASSRGFHGGSRA